MNRLLAIFGRGYAAAAILGTLFAATLLPMPMLLGDGAVWWNPPADLAQNLAGHLAFQAEAWRWPPLLARNLMWPDGVSIAMTDSNPVFSVAAKLLAGMVGRPVNLFGAWLAVCWVLQPVAAVYAVRSLGARSLPSALAAAVIALAFPALLARIEHINLCAHFLLLLGLGLSVRLVSGDGRRWWLAGALSLLTIFLHPFLFVLLAILLAAPVVARLLLRRGIGVAVAGYTASVVLPVAAFVVLAGSPGGSEFGFGMFSMNLASPFWPQKSGVFGADLPIIDATGGQREGFNYLGAGILLLAGLAVWAVLSRRGGLPGWRLLAGHAAVFAVLAGIAVSHKVYLGQWPVMVLSSALLETVMGPVRASGRAFWPIGYMLALVPIALLERRLSRPWLAGVLALAVALQWVDAQPLRAELRTYLAGVDRPSDLVALPPGATLLATATHCGPQGDAGVNVDRLRLAAVRAGINLADVRLSRTPRGMTCDSMTSDMLELALRPGEVRGFVGDQAKAALRTALLGPDVACRESRDMTLCGTAVTMGGTSAHLGADVPTIQPGQGAEGAALAPFLGWGWLADGGVMWSTGPRAVLLLRMPQTPVPPELRLRLQVEGIGRKPGQASRVQVAAGANTWPFAERFAQPAELADLRPTEIEVAVPADFGPGGIVRIVIAIAEPVDPRVRGTAMPVRWAGIRLLGVSALP